MESLECCWHSGMPYLYLPIVGFIATFLVLVPLPRQIRVRNIATISASFWLFGDGLKHSVEPIIWAGNVRNSAPVWCDISSHFRQASFVGIPAAALCVCKHLELVSSRRPIPCNNPTRRKVFDSMMCFALPCLWLLVCYCFQTARFVILEDFGCDLGFFSSNVAPAIIVSLPILLSVGTLVYGFVALCHLIKHHRETSKLLTSHLISRDATISLTQYCRLMAMSIVLGVWALAWISLVLGYEIVKHSIPLGSWNAIHSTDSTVIEVPASVYGPKILHQSQVVWWSFPSSAYLFFLLFATSREVWSEYQMFWVWFRTAILRLSLPKKRAALSSLHTESVPSHVLPVHIDMTITNDSKSSAHSSTQVP